MILDLTTFIEMPPKPQVVLGFIFKIILMICPLSISWNLNLGGNLCIIKWVTVCCPLLIILSASLFPTLTKKWLTCWQILIDQ